MVLLLRRVLKSSICVLTYPRIVSSSFLVHRQRHLSTLPILYQITASSEISSKPSIPKNSYVQISEGAVKQIKYLQTRDNNPNEALKVILESGGCHGFKILFDLTDTLEEDDILFDKDGAKIIVNKAFIPLIAGSTVDFTEELIGSTFKLVDNPNAASGCGCGISFELK